MVTNWGKDKKAALAVVSSSGAQLEFVTESLRADREVVLAAVSHDGFALRFASEALQGDREILLAAVSSDGALLGQLGTEYQADREFVLAAVSNNDGFALQYAHEKFQADRDVVLAATMSDGQALKFASEVLRGDEDFVLHCVRNHPADWEQMHIRRQALGRVQEARSLDAFLHASASVLAIRGHDIAPVLTVTLKRVEEDAPQASFLAEALLVSGKGICCDVPAVGTETRPAPVVEDLSVKLLEELRKNPDEIGEVTHIFINFQKNADEWETVTAWDHNRPLSDFVLQN